MNNICSLTNLDVGHCAKVGRLLSEGTIRRRLQDIGLIEGTEVECVLKSPCGGYRKYYYFYAGGIIWD